MNLSDVKIQWLWPSRQTDEPNIGFGVHAARFAWGMAAIGALIVLFVVLLVLGAPSNALLWTALISLVVTAGVFLVNSSHYRYYEVDQMARPLKPLNRTPPPEISGRRPTTKRKFLESGGTT